MSQPTEPTPPRLSTGVELECAVLYVFHSSNVFSTSRKEEKIIDDELPQPLCVPFPIESDKTHLETIGQRAVENAIRETLKVAGLRTDVIEIKQGAALTTERLSLFGHWSVGPDSSVRAHGLRDIKSQHQLRFAAIEITTPVEWDSPLSFEVIRYAVNLLASTFRIQINPSMGLHVHIGNGAAWMPFNWIRRMSMLFWAADRLLATLNPPTRSYNYFCPDIRDFSQLARNDHKNNTLEHDRERRKIGLSGKPLRPLLCREYIATDVRLGESSMMWREEHTDQGIIDAFRETRQPGHFEPFFIKSPPGIDDQGAESPESSELPIEKHTLDSKASDIGSLLGISDILNSKIIERTPFLHPERIPTEPARSIEDFKLTHVISGLRKRLNGFPRLKMPQWSEGDLRNIDQVNIDYSEHGVDKGQAEDRGVWFGVEQISQASASCEIANMLNSGYRANFNLYQYKCEYIGRSRCFVKGTIEWRQGAGSMDAKWVSTWARIVVGVSRFAIHAPVDLFLHMLDCCDYAERGGHYDVLDFLEDIGLVAEAKVAGKRIFDYGEAWGLEYEGHSENQPEYGDGEEVKESREGEASREGKGKEMEVSDASDSPEDADYSAFL